MHKKNTGVWGQPSALRMQEQALPAKKRGRRGSEVVAPAEGGTAVRQKGGGDEKMGILFQQKRAS